MSESQHNLLWLGNFGCLGFNRRIPHGKKRRPNHTRQENYIELMPHGHKVEIDQLDRDPKCLKKRRRKETIVRNKFVLVVCPDIGTIMRISSGRCSYRFLPIVPFAYPSTSQKYGRRFPVVLGLAWPPWQRGTWSWKSSSSTRTKQRGRDNKTKRKTCESTCNLPSSPFFLHP